MAVQALVQAFVQALSGPPAQNRPVFGAALVQAVVHAVQALVQPFVQAFSVAKPLFSLAFFALCRLCRRFTHERVGVRTRTGRRAGGHAIRRRRALARTTPSPCTPEKSEEGCGLTGIRRLHKRLHRRLHSLHACTAPRSAFPLRLKVVVA